jgi:hypothetical protein
MSGSSRNSTIDTKALFAKIHMTREIHFRGLQHRPDITWSL